MAKASKKILTIKLQCDKLVNFSSFLKNIFEKKIWKNW